MAEIILSVSGSRLFVDEQLFNDKINDFINKYGKITKIVHGGANGADTIAEQWANERGIETIVFKPDYKNEEMIKKYGKKIWGKIAPLERNKDIAAGGTHLLAFPLDEEKTGLKSNGTLSTILHAKKLNKIIEIIHVIP